MQIVVDIPSSLYANLNKIQNGTAACRRILNCVKEGVPLPKGHGRLVDADAILTDPYGDTVKDIDIAETIIEADDETKVDCQRTSCNNCVNHSYCDYQPNLINSYK